MIKVTDKIHLARIRPEDAQDLQRIADDPIMRQNVGDNFPHPYTLDDAKFFINLCAEEYKKEFGQRNLGIYIDGKYSGNLGRHQREKGREIHNVHLGYRLGKDHRGKGNMTSIVSKVLELIDKDIPDWHRIYAHVVASNIGSRRVLEKNGFVLEGTLKEAHLYEGERYDDWVLGLVRSEKKDHGGSAIFE